MADRCASSTNTNAANAALIVGAGMAGMEAALLLAEMEHKVYLLDSAPGIGGSLHLLDRTFPTDSCGLCFLEPYPSPGYCPTLECALHPLVEIVPYAEVESLEGEPGNFTVSIRHKPRYVDIDRCDGCGLCAEVCPVEMPSRYEGELCRQKAIYRPPSRAVPGAYLVDMDYCTRCGKCIEVCPTDAIDLEMDVVTTSVVVGAIILCPGFEPFDARVKGEYGYGLYDNVLTSIQFERMISLSGSTGAEILRPSDGKAPKRLAFIQCVGSRDEALGRGYCSSVCCMYTAKQVAIAKELNPDLQIAVFHMDIRTFGKGFERYFDRVKMLPGVTYQRCMVSSIKQLQQTRDLRLAYVAEDGSFKEEDFDLVVLAVGFGPPVGFQELGRALSVELDQFGFAATKGFAPHETTRAGVFVSGAFGEPKDIPETVVDAASAAMSAANLLARSGGSPIRPTKEYPAEKDVADEEPRVGVFVCRCGDASGEEIASVVDLAEVVAHAGQLKGVSHVQELPYACTEAGLMEIKGAITERGLNRVVVAGCTSRLYETSLQEALREAGLNPCLLEQANLREGCAWAHRDRPSEATAKAKDMVEMAVAKVQLLKAVQRDLHDVAGRALVIGGGVAGLTASLALAGQGFAVYLVEKEEELGGHLCHIHYTLDGSDPQVLLSSLIAEVERNELIHLYLGSEVKEVSGYVGNFTVEVTSNEAIRQQGKALVDSSLGASSTFNVGAIIVATGGQEAVPTEYLYRQDPRVMTQREFEALLAEKAKGQQGNELMRQQVSKATLGLAASEPVASLPSSVVMIQCVGSREPDRPYCSRICCSQAIKNALKLKELNPEAKIYVLYREVRTYGFHELYYQEARGKGVVFIRYELPAKPQVEASEEGLKVRTTDPILGREVVLDADLLVLSTGIAPNDNRALADVLAVPLDEDNFFQEANPKLRPVDFETRGVFLCGLAHAPKFIDETIAQANAAAMKAVTLLGARYLETKATVATVNERLCSGCGLCISACPYDARVMNEETRRAEVIDILCQGCGICVMVCPNGASQQKIFENKQMLAMIDAAL